MTRKTDVSKSKDDEPCPNCGHCPTCGRANATPQFVPVPYYIPQTWPATAAWPWPYYVQPTSSSWRNGYSQPVIGGAAGVTPNVTYTITTATT